MGTLGRMWLWAVIAWYGLASLAAFAVFAWDKAMAASGARRIPERTLHAMSLAGGWPGSILAMVLLRHKVRKPGFVVLTGACVVAHAALWAVVLSRPH